MSEHLQHSNTSQLGEELIGSSFSGPRHIAIILDGNGRWAKKRKLPRIQGHVQGAKRAKEIVTYCSQAGVPVLTLYAFSTENWSRPKSEVSFLMELLRTYIRDEGDEIIGNNISLRTIGQIESMPKVVREELSRVVEASRDNTGLKLNFALSYGSRNEIVMAAKKLARASIEGKLDPSDINEERFSESLYTRGLPDPDLLIRTSGELRISNFLLWQLAYCELYFTDTPWPDFTVEHLNRAIEDYQGRERRFGRISSSTI